MSALCSCVVVAHPAGSVWITQTVDKSCPEHVFGERYTGPETPGTGHESAARVEVALPDTWGAARPSDRVFENRSAK